MKPSPKKLFKRTPLGSIGSQGSNSDLNPEANSGNNTSDSKENGSILPQGTERGAKKAQRETKIKECLKTLNAQLAGKGPEGRNSGQLLSELTNEYMSHESNIQALGAGIEKLQRDAAIAEEQRSDMDKAVTEARNHLELGSALKEEILTLKSEMAATKKAIERIERHESIAKDQREELDKTLSETRMNIAEAITLKDEMPKYRAEVEKTVKALNEKTISKENSIEERLLQVSAELSKLKSSSRDVEKTAVEKTDKLKTEVEGKIASMQENVDTKISEAMAKKNLAEETERDMKLKTLKNELEKSLEQKLTSKIEKGLPHD